jgi:hypothetical protein
MLPIANVPNVTCHEPSYKLFKKRYGICNKGFLLFEMQDYEDEWHPNLHTKLDSLMILNGRFALPLLVVTK